MPSGLNLDEDVTLLSKGLEAQVPDLQERMDIEIPPCTPTVVDTSGLHEHITQLFLKTLGQSNFPLAIASGLKQLLMDNQHMFATSSADLYPAAMIMILA